MDIVFLCSSFPRYKGDGASVFLLNLASALTREGHCVHVIAPDDADVDPTWRPRGIMFHRFRYTVGPLRLAYGAGIVPNLHRNPLVALLIPGFLIAMAYKTWRVASTVKPDVLHAHWIFPCGLVATALRRMFGSRIAVSAHGSDVFSLRGRLWTALRDWVLARSGAWTANTIATRDAASSLHLQNGFIIPMGVDCDLFAKGDRTLGRGQLSDDTFLILFVGRLIRMKGADVLLDAVSRLDRSKKFALWIAGDGPERRTLERAADDLGIRAHTQFLGPLKHDTLPDLYAAADVFVAPSRNLPGVGQEGQGTVILEAMAADCCVIGTATGGIPEVIVHERTGLLVPQNDPGSLAGAIDRVAADTALRERLASEGCALANRRYDWKYIANEFSRLYSRFL